MTEYSREDIRLMFIREFGAGEEFNIGRSVTSSDFQERIRLAIWRNNKSTTLYFDTEKTYADMFTKLFGCSIEKRKISRPERIDPLSEFPDDPLND